MKKNNKRKIVTEFILMILTLFLTGCMISGQETKKEIKYKELSETKNEILEENREKTEEKIGEVPEKIEDCKAEEVTMSEFTMEDLIVLCDEGSETLKSAMTDFTEDGELPYSNFEKNVSEYSLTWDYFCILPHEGREYRMQVSYWKPEEAEEYGHFENELEGIYLYYPVAKDTQLLYAAEDRFTSNLDIRSFLDKEYNLESYVEIKLPDTLKLGNYRRDLTMGQDGCLFEGDYEETFHGNGTPEDWYAPGGIKFIEKQYFDFFGNIRFEDGKMKEIEVLQNHSAIDSDFEVVEGCDMQAVLCEFYFDLFTAAEAEEYMNEYGISEEEFPWHSRYWYVFFAEEDSQYVYMLFLNQEYFDKGDILELARSMKFMVK